jgi:hypothetical protein
MGDEYKVMEINSVTCSGLYKCDLEAYVKEMSRISLNKWDKYKNVLYDE